MTGHALESQDGFAVHLLRSETVELRIVPELGAKISSLHSRRTGREWMWSPPAARFFSNNLRDPFAESTLVGADECFPTVGPCPWADRDLPDHGEVWSQKWEIEADHDSITTTLQCPVSPFAISRRVALHGSEVNLRYSVKNTGTTEEAYLWAFHPLLNIAPGDRLELPASHFQADMSMNCPFGGWADQWDRQWDWPRPVNGIDLADMDFGPHRAAAVKLFTPSLREGRAALHNPHTGDRLEFLFALSEIDTLGIWINRGAWNDFHHVAIEPSLGAPDRLDIAAGRTKRCRHLPAGGAASWAFTLRLS
jgi:galactose mutarotase-like enzyme